MTFNDHSKLVGQHAFLGASKSFWLGYDEEKVTAYYNNILSIAKGTRLHAYAAECINLGQKLPKSSKTLNMYVNDAIGYRMHPEQILYYSENCFGTADAISFKDKVLRIHDLKTGTGKTHMEQLIIYAALFCLEYKIKPSEIEIELRIYQNDEVWVHNPGYDEIVPVMDKIISFDKVIKKIKQREE